jgi:drug/metabolite transporter (DMT)-like permease
VQFLTALRDWKDGIKMTPQESKEYLGLKAILAMVLITFVWGFNHTAIKYSNQGISPVFASLLRSVIASACGVIYCLVQRQRLFHTGIMLFHGFMVGLLFGLEFACIYIGLLYTDAARSVVFVFMAPFVIALGAHFFLKGDRLTLLKTAGLILAFMGVYLIFRGKPITAKPTMFIGDILAILAAIFYGATIVYIKKFMAEKVHPINTFLYQLIFSIPILLIVSLILESRWIFRWDFSIGAALFYQSLIVAFISYFAWFKLIHQYSISRLSAFTFLTPVFGVLSGVLFLHEELTRSLVIGVPLVCFGIALVNWRRKS